MWEQTDTCTVLQWAHSNPKISCVCRDLSERASFWDHCGPEFKGMASYKMALTQHCPVSQTSPCGIPTQADTPLTAGSSTEHCRRMSAVCWSQTPPCQHGAGSAVFSSCPLKLSCSRGKSLVSADVTALMQLSAGRRPGRESTWPAVHLLCQQSQAVCLVWQSWFFVMQPQKWKLYLINMCVAILDCKAWLSTFCGLPLWLFTI